MSENKRKKVQRTPHNVVFITRVNKDNGYLCKNFHLPFSASGLSFTSSSQYYVWCKQQMFDKKNKRLEEEILGSESSRALEKCNFKIKNYDDVKWRKVRYSVLFESAKLKLEQNPDFLKMLLDTGDDTIIYASRVDYEDGIGISEESFKDGVRCFGKNNLGKVCMEIRNEFRKK
jgi:ribA/ribD-fused uncharacterized protein